MGLDLALTEGDDGKPLLHRPDCIVVELHRAQGRPIMTMLDCQGQAPTDIKRHWCLGPKDE